MFILHGLGNYAPSNFLLEVPNFCETVFPSPPFRFVHTATATTTSLESVFRSCHSVNTTSCHDTHFYRPQRSCEGYVFTPPRGGSASVHTGIPPAQSRPHRTRHPPDQAPPWEQTPPGPGTPRDQASPPPDGYCCGWYASY